MKRMLKVLTAVAVGAVVSVGVAAAAASPTVRTGLTSKVTNTSAVLSGTVNPDGTSTQYQFQWGLTSAYGLAGTTHSAGSGTKPVTEQSTAGGLIPGTVYHYRLVALNKFGVALGGDRTFKTHGFPPPGVFTGPATQITTTGATLTGTVNPNGQATTYTFQYGTTTAFGQESFGQTLPAGTLPQTVTFALKGLTPGTVFFFRLVAVHGASVVEFGAPESFLTLPSPRPVPRVRAGTKPRIARSKPYSFTTTGSVRHPSWIPASLGCTGDVTIRLFNGRRQVGSTFVALDPTCAFSAKLSFRHLIGHHATPLRMTIHFRGNSYLAPANARNEHVVLG